MLSSLLEILNLGGPIIWLLLFMSALSLTVFVAKVIQFKEMGMFDLRVTRPCVDDWVAGNRDKAIQGLNRLKNSGKQALPLSLLTAMVAIQSDGISEKQARETAARVAADCLDRLQAGLRILEFIATSSPLLGLLGTVMGMIEAFRAMEEAGRQVDPSILSGGIWVALMTTAAGLIVAIPSLAMLNVLERRLERLHHELQSSSTRLFTDQTERLVEEKLPKPEWQAQPVQTNSYGTEKTAPTNPAEEATA